MVSFQPLPDRAADASYPALLAELLDLVGAEHPEPAEDTPRGRRSWQHAARRTIGKALAGVTPREEWFAPLARAAVLEPDPSFNRDLVRPMVELFGRRRVREALLDHLGEGSDAERAGAARAWYWTLIGVRFEPGTRTPTAASQAELDAYADLDRRYGDTALRVFVATDNIDVRRCILPGLDLRPRGCRPELRDLVAEATRIARESADDYLRHRVEIQVAE
ncbi:MAG TPA: hypothetical protein VGP16_37240 [Asanoa sp.]|jgi:hypothetical protein|nr:hypothetical protein [Asanoa sp.]